MSGPQLFIHTSRPNWGRAILAAEADDRRHYQFEDGRVRTIARDYYDLLQPIQPEEHVAKKAARRLLTLLKHSDFDEPTTSTPTVSMTFGDQIALFKAALPEGFEAESFYYAKTGSARESLVPESKKPESNATSGGTGAAKDAIRDSRRARPSASPSRGHAAIL